MCFFTVFFTDFLKSHSVISVGISHWAVLTVALAVAKVVSQCTIVLLCVVFHKPSCSSVFWCVKHVYVVFIASLDVICCSQNLLFSPDEMGVIATYVCGSYSRIWCSHLDNHTLWIKSTHRVYTLTHTNTCYIQNTTIQCKNTFSQQICRKC